jgi:hypothetical protein
MVKGIDIFREHFKSFKDSFVIIGGTALDLQMGESGLSFRTTKDIDIVLQVEALSEGFLAAFWDFIRKGKYQNRQKSTGKKLFYRFDKPGEPSFPFMIELFSRKPGVIEIRGESNFTPVPAGEDLSSLSAILLDEEYYSIMKQGKKEINGLPVVSAEYLIPLKAKAFLDLTSLKAGGAQIDEKDIRKHKNDVFRLVQIITPDDPLKLPVAIKGDLKAFLDSIRGKPGDLTQLGIRNLSFSELLEILERKYEIS